MLPIFATLCCSSIWRCKSQEELLNIASNANVFLKQPDCKLPLPPFLKNLRLKCFQFAHSMFVIYLWRGKTLFGLNCLSKLKSFFIVIKFSFPSEGCLWRQTNTNWKPGDARIILWNTSSLLIKFPSWEWDQQLIMLAIDFTQFLHSQQ